MSTPKHKDTIKQDSNYMLISFGYDSKIILPYKDAVVLINSLEKAETYNERYGKDTTITDFKKDAISISFIGFQEYAEIKLNSLISGNGDI